MELNFLLSFINRIRKIIAVSDVKYLKKIKWIWSSDLNFWVILVKLLINIIDILITICDLQPKIQRYYSAMLKQDGCEPLGDDYGG